MHATPEIRSTVGAALRRQPAIFAMVFAAVVALFAVLLPSAASAAPEFPESGVDITTSCLAGNGRIDINVINIGAEAARYRVEFGTLSAREYTVEPMDWWRMPITGRPDDLHDIVIERDGRIITEGVVEVQCDSDIKLSDQEVKVLSACRGDAVNRGYVMFQMVNDSDTASPYIIEFEGVRNRSTTAAAWGQALRSVTGRPNGTYAVRVVSQGEQVYQGEVTVDCPPPGEPIPAPTPGIGPLPEPPPSVDSAVVEGGPSIGGGGIPGPIPGPGGGGPDPQPGTLTAADVDDNLNFTFFTGYLEWVQQNSAQLPSVVLDDRLTINLVDDAGLPLSNARLVFTGPADGTFTSTASAGGTVRVFPTYSGISDPIADGFEVFDPTTGNSVVIDLDGTEFDDNREATITVSGLSGALPDALDVAFVIDATGSMSDEMSYLQTEFTSIVEAVEARHPDIDMKFALIVYRDIGDDYVVRTFDFAASASMLTDLNAQSANGGGDYPEAMEEALAAAGDLSWRTDANVSRIVVLNADAPPHDENLQAALDESAALAGQGVRVYPLAASGVADTAEYLMRVMAATTGGRHLFLTDDSGVGGTHQEPLIACEVVTRLDNLLIRILDGELAGERIEAADDAVIRTVGDSDAGVCELDEFTPPQPPEPCVGIPAVAPDLGAPAVILPPEPPCCADIPLVAADLVDPAVDVLPPIPC